MKFIIKKNGQLIAGFSKTHQVVQTAGTADFAKLFPTRRAAEKFIETYGDAGYAMQKGECHIEEVGGR